MSATILVFIVAQVFIIGTEPKAVAARPHNGAISVSPGKINR